MYTSVTAAVKNRKSNCVREVERLTKNREERRSGNILHTKKLSSFNCDINFLAQSKAR